MGVEMEFDSVPVTFTTTAQIGRFSLSLGTDHVESKFTSDYSHSWYFRKDSLNV